MKDLKQHSSSKTARKPYGPVTEPEHVVIALYEILALANQANAEQIATIAKDIVQVIQRERMSVAELAATN